MNKIVAFLFLLSIHFFAKAQNATFITINSGGQLTKVTIGASGCTNTPLNLCNNFTGSPLSIALDGTTIYIVDNQGFLYSNTLTATGTSNTCTKLGKFSTPLKIYGMTVGPGGIVYAATGSVIESYNPSTNAFATLGSINSSWTIGGDLLFYQGNLYEAVKVSGGNNALVQVNLSNVSASTLYMNFNAGTSVFGFASVTVPCSSNAAYALSTNGSTTDIFSVDMTNKIQSTTITCTLPFAVNDAASIAETQSATAPSKPIATSPFNICQGDAINFIMPTVSSVKDTLRWYTQAVNGNSYGSPTPAISSSTIGTTNYYVSAFDTSTGCESSRDTIVVGVNAYPAVPTINPKDSSTICTGSNITLTSSATTGNQWKLNGTNIIGAISKNFTTNVAGNYTVTTTTVAGCSKTSLPTKLIVTDTIKSTTNQATCTSQLPFTWNGLTFNSAGTQTKKGLISSAGCDSAATLVLTVTDTIKTTATQTICAADLPYTWYGVVFNAAGSQVLNVTSNAGCDSAVTLVLNVNPPAITNNINLFDCNSVIYKGNTYVNDTTIRDTLKAIQGCDSVYNVAHITVGMRTAYAYITNTVSNDVSVINTLTNVVIATIAVGLQPVGVSVTPNGKSVYISNYKSNDVSVINTLNNTVVSTIVVGLKPVGIIISPDGLKAYVTNWGSNTINVISTTTNSVIGTIPVGTNPEGIAISPDGGRLYVTNYGSNTISVVNTSNVTVIATIPVGASPQGVNVSPDGLKVYVCNEGSNSVSVINTINNTIITTIPVANSPLGISIDRSGLKLYVSNAASNTISVINTNTNSVVATIVVGFFPNGISISQDGLMVYVANFSSNSVSVINSFNNQVVSTINVGVHPAADGNFIANVRRTATKDTINLSDCNSIIYKGNTYTTSTILKDTLKSYQGCDSVYNTVNIVISPTATSNTVNLKSCDNIIYKGITYTSSTTIKDTLKTVQGCDSVYNIANITVNASPAKPIASVTVQPNCSNPTGTIVVTNPVGTNYLYSVDGTNFQSSTIFAGLAPATYLVSAKDSNTGCISASLSLIVDTAASAVPTPTGYVTVQPSCSNPLGTFIISSPHGNNYSYYINAGAISFIDTTFANYPSGAYSITAMDNNTGCISAALSLTLNPYTPIVATTNTKNLSDCKSIIYKGITYNASTILKDTTKSTQGCDSIYNVVNIVVTPVNATTQTINLSSCSVVNYGGINYTTSTVLKDTTKSVQGCDSIYKTVNIAITPMNATTQTINLVGCNGVNYNGVNYNISTTIKDTTKSAQGCDSVYLIVKINITPLIASTKSTNYTGCNSVVYKNINYTTSTSFSDTVKSVQGCDSIYNINNIVVNPNPTITLNDKVYVFLGNSVMLNPYLTNASTIIWSPAKYLDDSTAQNPICTPLTNQTYKLKVITDMGCSDSSIVNVLLALPLKIPNVFSPNGDGINDNWDIGNTEAYISGTIQVFNRYGQQLLSNHLANYKPWNGKYNGQDVPVGVYYYIIHTSANGETITGSVTVLR